MNSLLKAFKKQLTSGQTDATGSQAAGEQLTTKSIGENKKTGDAGKVQLTEPTLGKRDRNPFGQMNSMLLNAGVTGNPHPASSLADRKLILSEG